MQVHESAGGVLLRVQDAWNKWPTNGHHSLLMAASHFLPNLSPSISVSLVCVFVINTLNGTNEDIFRKSLLSKAFKEVVVWSMKKRELEREVQTLPSADWSAHLTNCYVKVVALSVLKSNKIVKQRLPCMFADVRGKKEEPAYCCQVKFPRENTNGCVWLTENVSVQVGTKAIDLLYTYYLLSVCTRILTFIYTRRDNYFLGSTLLLSTPLRTLKYIQNISKTFANKQNVYCNCSVEEV